MLQPWKNWCQKLTISGAIIALSGNYAPAQSQIVPDSTLGAESSVVTPNVNIQGIPSDRIDGGAIRGANLFHSFQDFNIGEDRGAYFTKPTGIENILTRVTGSNPSNILGRLGVLGGANLFLLNPNGIIFGPNASLAIGGSFVASTASSLKFADQTQFSATQSQATPLLTVSVPVGLQFGGSAGNIVNKSGALDSNGIPVGLQVDTGKTLALVGGNVALEGGNLTARAGRIELGSVAGPSLVSLTPAAQGWTLGYEGVQNFRDIELSQAAFVDASGEFRGDIQLPGRRGGDIQVQGRRVTLTDGSAMAAITRGSLPGGTVTVKASDSVILSGFVTTAQGPFGSGLTTDTVSAGAAGNLTINTRKLIVQNGAQVSTSTSGQGQGGRLKVNASDSVELSATGPNGQSPSGFLTQTRAAGAAGDLTIKTGRLIARNGAQVSAGTGRYSRGKGGNLTVTADSVELVGSGSGLFAQTQGASDAGNLSISTGSLTIRDRAEVSVNSQVQGAGNAGNLEVTARSIRLDNRAALRAESIPGKEGQINLRVTDLLVLRRNSQISTKAGTESTGGEGGNITIDAPFIVAVASENSDILANAYRGSGGNAQIRAQDIFGTQLRQTTTLGSDITASGSIRLDTPTFIDPSRGLVTLPAELVDVAGLITPGCSAGGGGRGTSEFIVTGRGGLPPAPREALASEPALADLGTLVQGQENANRAATSTNSTSSQPVPLVEAQGWVIGSNGEVVLTAQAPTVTAHNPWLTPTTCHGS